MLIKNLFQTFDLFNGTRMRVVSIKKTLLNVNYCTSKDGALSKESRLKLKTQEWHLHYGDINSHLDLVMQCPLIKAMVKHLTGLVSIYGHLSLIMVNYMWDFHVLDPLIMSVYL